MKRILFSLMAVVLSLGLIGSAFAYFSDVETSTGNTFTAGTIDIAVDGENPWYSTTLAELDMKPSMKVWDIILVTNVGNNPLKLWKHLGDRVYIEKENVYYAHASSEPEYVAEGGTFTNGVPKGDNVAISNVDTKIDYSLIIARKADDGWGDTVGDFDTVTGIPDAADAGTNDLIIHAQGEIVLSEVWSYWYGPWELTPDQSLIIAQDYHLQDDTGNEYQGDGVRFTVDFYAEQLGGLGPPPSP